MDEKELLKIADAARGYAYAPYSHFTVGAALLAASGRVYSGCNVENASYGAANCAERTAFFKAVSEGENQFEAIAIVGGKEGQKPEGICAPCGICRQVMREFADPGRFRVILQDGNGNEKSYLLEELLPESFGPENL